MWHGASLADAAVSIDMVERYAAMAAGIGWTRSVLDQAGLLGTLVKLPEQLRLRLADGTTILGVHSSPQADDGPGIEPGIADEQLGPPLAGCAADVVVGGHTHSATDRVIGNTRAFNPGSTGLPRTVGNASWLLLEDCGGGLAVTHRSVPFDIDAMIGDLNRRRHPSADFVSAGVEAHNVGEEAPGRKLGVQPGQRGCGVVGLLDGFAGSARTGQPGGEAVHVIGSRKDAARHNGNRSALLRDESP